MKRFLFFILLFVGILPAMGQNSSVVYSDSYSKDGTRQVLSESRTFHFGGGDISKYSFYVKAFATQLDTTYTICVASYLKIPYDATLLLKTKEGDIIHLDVDNVVVRPIDNPSYSYITGNLVTTIPSGTTDYYAALFPLSKSDIRLIRNHKIVKMRLSNQNGYMECEFGTDRFARWFRYCFEEIRRTLQEVKIPKRTDIYEDF